VRDAAGAGGDLEPRIRPLATAQSRFVDRMDHRLVNVLTALGFGLPVIGYFSFLQLYSVNALVGDQWDLITMIKQSYVHFFDWGPMWTQHNENRIFFPNIITLLLVHTDHFNVQVEAYVGALMLAAALVFLLWAHKRRSPSTPWLYYCPVVIVALSVVQYGNTIWGFQLAWYLVLLCLAATILLLDSVTLNWIGFVAALATAVVGSFSSLQGLLIWPTGFVLLYFRRRSYPVVGVWIGVAIATTVLYFHRYQSTTPGDQLTLEHPFVALKFFLLAIGDVVGKPIASGNWSNGDTLVLLFGVLTLLVALGSVLICGLRRDEHSATPIGIALICYGLLFAIMITQGRIIYGYTAASFSRYTTYDLLVLVGVYLALLGRHPRVVNAAGSAATTVNDETAIGRWRSSGVKGWLERGALPCVRVAVLLAILVQIPFGLYNGVQGARLNHAQFVKAAATLRNINDVSDSHLSFDLLLIKPPSFIREQARTLEEHRLSVFGGG
jgi:hypothetical protein